MVLRFYEVFIFSLRARLTHEAITYMSLPVGVSFFFFSGGEFWWLTNLLAVPALPHLSEIVGGRGGCVQWAKEHTHCVRHSGGPWVIAPCFPSDTTVD